MPDIMLMGKNPNFLGSWDLYDIPGQEITATIAKLQDEEVITNGQKEGCTVMHFEENYKPMILNLTNKKMLARLYKTKASEKLVGKKVKIRFEKVKAFGRFHDALRIQNEIPKETTAPLPECSDCGGNITAANSMTPEQVAAYTAKNYGRRLCAKCAVEAKKAKEASNGAE